MPARNDYLCEICGLYKEYWCDGSDRPTCCGETMSWAPSRPPAVDAKEPYHEFDYEANGRRYHIDSLHALRKVEAESERMARNGDGAPLVWRDYSQDHSNFDRHTLAPGGNINRPVDGYAGSDTGEVKVDPKMFRVRKGADVTKTHGTV